MTDNGAFTIRDTDFRLVVGEELLVSALELSSPGISVRFSVDELGQLKTLLGLRGRMPSGDLWALVTVAPRDSEAVEHFADGELGEWFATLNEQDASGLFTEAKLRAWCQLLKWATADTLALSRGDAELIGRLPLTGEPLLTEFIADRVHQVYRGGHASDVNAADETLKKLEELAAAKVRFGLSELASTRGDRLYEAAEAACERDGWCQWLRIGLGVELARVANAVVAIAHGTELPVDPGAQLDLNRERRNLAETALDLLQEEIGPWTRLRYPRRVRGVSEAREYVDAFVSAFHAPAVGTTTALSFEGAASLIQDDVFDEGQDPSELILFSGDEEFTETDLTVADLTDALTRVIANRPEQYKDVIGRVRRESIDSTDASLALLRRRSLRWLDRVNLADAGAGDDLLRLTLNYALPAAELRGVDLNESDEVRKLTDGIARPWIVTGSFDRLAPAGGHSRLGILGHLPQVQVKLVEAVFNRLALLKPLSHGNLDKVLQMGRAKQRHGDSERSIDRAANRVLLSRIDRVIGQVAV